LVAGLASTLRVGALTADAVAPEARKAQEAEYGRCRQREQMP
jgi:hypothetical protein